MAIVKISDTKVEKLTPQEQAMISELRTEIRTKGGPHEHCLLTVYQKGCNTFSASTNKDTFMEFAANELYSEFGWNKTNIKNTEEFQNRIYKMIFQSNIDKNTGRPFGIIPLLASYAEPTPQPDGNPPMSQVDKMGYQIEKGFKVLKLLENQNSEEFKAQLTREKAKKTTDPRTPEVRVTMQINAFREDLKVKQATHKELKRLIQIANINHLGEFFTPEKASKNLAVRIQKQFDDNLGAGAIDLSMFDV